MSHNRNVRLFKELKEFRARVRVLDQKKTIEAPKVLKEKENLLQEKENKLHEIRRAARDAVLNKVLGDLGLPGGIASGVKGIAIKFDKAKLDKNKDGSLNHLEDHVTDTTALQKEIDELKKKIEELRLRIFDETVREPISRIPESKRRRS